MEIGGSTGRTLYVTMTQVLFPLHPSPHLSYCFVLLFLIFPSALSRTLSYDKAELCDERREVSAVSMVRSSCVIRAAVVLCLNESLIERKCSDGES